MTKMTLLIPSARCFLVFTLWIAISLLPGCAAAPPAPSTEAKALSAPERFIQALQTVNMDTDTEAQMRTRIERAIQGTGWSFKSFVLGMGYETHVGRRREMGAAIDTGGHCVRNLDWTAFLGYPSSVNARPFFFLEISDPEKIERHLRKGLQVTSLGYPLKSDLRYQFWLQTDTKADCFSYLQIVPK